ncbi:MAG: alkaline phosphatase family protein [Elusimicrobiota bacterium]|nr:alkaline phosphatase family protein [Elusimicrobiota bacterium]
MLKRKSVLLLLIIMLFLSVSGGFFFYNSVEKESTPGFSEKKVIILGFDGIDPDLLSGWMDEGKLPSLKRLRESGTFSELGTTNPAESPVAWSSFATGTNPGKTSIFDFLKRDPQTYMPDLATTSFSEGKFLLRLFPVEKPSVTCNRKGTSFWQIASRNGLKCVVLQAPVTFPPEKVAGGKLLSGLGVPDIRGTQGTFSYYASDVRKEGDTEMGGKITQVKIEDKRIETAIYGPRNRLSRRREDILVPLEIEIISDKQAIINVQDREEKLTVGQWSDWFVIKFKMNPLIGVYGMGRFYLISIKPEFRLYLCPINFYPKKPPFPISYPKSFCRKLAEEIGLYKTLGWAIDTWALSEKRIDEKTFLEDLFYTMNQREEIMMNMLEKKNFDLFIFIFQASDRAQHMFWRLIDETHPAYDREKAEKYGDAILKVYQKMDEIVGEVMPFVEENTTLFVISDHGFHPFRKAVNLNTWLVKNGYMTLLSQEGKEYKLEDLFGKGEFWPNVDWQRTKAYALGLGCIYINLKGREAYGIVKLGDEYNGLGEEIVAKLKNLRDPVTGKRVIVDVYKREDIYQGEYLEEAPDLVVGFNEGYRVSWQTALGGIPPKVIVENKSNWSGDHCSFDPSITQGIFISNKKFAGESPSIIDIAPTVLELFNLPIPEEMDGEPIRFRVAN